MKAVVLTAPRSLRLLDLPSRALASRELRVRVKAACICGSDLKNYRNPAVAPLVQGHEFSGVVTEVARDSDGRITVGDRVAAFPMIACLKCAPCSRREYRDCDAKLSLGFELPGAFAEEVVFDERFAVRLPEGISFEQGALLEHLCCGYRLAQEVLASHPSIDGKILILGDGPIALADLQALRTHGYRDISLVGRRPARLRLAEQLGARVVTAERAAESRVDICILAAPADAQLATLLGAMDAGSVLFPQTRVRDPEVLDRIARLRVGFGRAFTYAIQDFDSMMDRILDGTIKTDQLVTSRIPLPSLPEKMKQLMAAHDEIKVMVLSS